MDKFFTLPDVCQEENSLDCKADASLPIVGEEFLHGNKKSRFTKEEQLDLWKSMDMAKAAKEALQFSLSEKEKETCQELLRKGSHARNLLIEDNFGLVGFVCKKYTSVTSRTTLEVKDLMQDGYMGLMRAVDRYDYQRGICFSTYAVPWINQGIRRGILAEKSDVRLPEHVDSDLRHVRKAKEELCERLGRDPEAEEIGKELGMKTEKVKMLLNMNPDTLSLEHPSENAEGSVCDMLALIPDEKAMDPVKELEEKELMELIGEALDSCSERNRAILRMRYGFENGKIYTFEEISKQVNLSREGVRSVIKKELKRIRTSAYFQDKLAAYRNAA